MRYFLLIAVLFVLSCKQNKKRYDVDEVEYYEQSFMPDSIPVKICGWASNYKYSVAIVFDSIKQEPLVYLDTIRHSKLWKDDYLDKRICAEGTLIYRKGMRIKKWNVIKDGKKMPRLPGINSDFQVLINYKWYLEK